MEKCPHCGSDLVGEMRFCAACGKQARGQQVTPPVVERKAPVLLIALVLLGLVGCGLFYSLSSAGRRAASGADEISAFVMCKQFVTERLKSPSTAVFPTYGSDGTITVRLSDVAFISNAYVDSQNGFGATVRTKYACTVRHTGGANWRLDDLKIN